LRTPVCSTRYEIGWDHFDASMSSCSSLSLSLSLPLSLVVLFKISLTPTVLSCTHFPVCVRAPAKGGIRSRGIAGIHLTAPNPANRSRYSPTATRWEDFSMFALFPLISHARGGGTKSRRLARDLRLVNWIPIGGTFIPRDFVRARGEASLQLHERDEGRRLGESADQEAERQVR